MKTFKTVAEFKQKLQIGDRLKSTFHMAFAGRDKENKPIYKDVENPIRPVSEKQTNSFALETVKDGKIVNSWCDYPKASHCRIENNRLTILEKDLRNVTGGMDNSNPEYANAPLIPVLTYEFAE